MSLIFARAAAEYRTMRAEYETVNINAHAAAESACNGVLLNRRGKLAHVDPESLFKGTHARAYAYASAELVEHWTKHPRLTVAEFERQTLEVWTEEVAA